MENNSTLSTANQLPANIPDLPPKAVLSKSIGSNACPWLDEYVKFSQKWSPESFTGFHEGCGLFVLSTTAARRVVFDLGGIHATNLYIGLMGNTSIHSKSTAAMIGVDLLHKAGLGWLLAPDEATPQKLVQDMSSVYLPSNYHDLDKEKQEREINMLLTAGQRGWFVDEFDENISAMMRPDSVMFGMKGLLRKLDGAPNEYKYSTISRGNNFITNPYLTILGNITLAGLTPYVKKRTMLWGDGTLARFASITPSPSNIEFGRFPNETRIFPDSLISPLIKWHNRLGLPSYEIVGSDNGLRVNFTPLQPQHLGIRDEAYDAFYHYHDSLRVLIRDEIPYDLAGNYARFPEKALRIAAIFASFQNNDYIELNHWAKAQFITERWRVGLHEMYTQLIADNQGPETKFINQMSVEGQILRAISLKKSPSAREISQFTHLKMDILKPALRQLLVGGKISNIQIGNQKQYILISGISESN